MFKVYATQTATVPVVSFRTRAAAVAFCEMMFRSGRVA